MKGFNRKEGQLFIDDISLKDIAKKFGTPVYVYSANKLKENLNNYLSSVRKEDKVCYSVKSNSNIHILSLLSELGSGFDVVSGNELRRCLEAGAKAENIVFSGVGKTKEEIRLAINTGIFSINIESEEELERIINISKDLKKQVECIIRINPDLSSESHPYIQTGLKTSKFGVLKEKVDSMARKASESGSVNLKGIASHVGSQIFDKEDRLPDSLVACIGGGSNAIGLFHPFLDDEAVRVIGVEAAGEGIETGKHAASLSAGMPGVLHGNRTYLLQDQDGQINEAHSISAGLDYPGIGPEHAWLYDIGRVEYVSVTDKEAVLAFQLTTKTEGIIPALESAHAVAHAVKIAGELPKDHIMIINMSGRGDKDIDAVAQHLREN